ncbi:hypothetical protein C1646_769466 [Rhizophagus diaphanus]|nr:hypothetical protein C1646_769466 [Rhizophagus diaphanus] [Rhizophagus sp. MUCL 43196]
MLPPYFFIDGNKIHLIVAQRCIEVPSPVELSKQYYRCNGFIIYRGLLQDVLRGELLVDISRFASETWKIASKDFRNFFSDYARNTNGITAKRAEFKQFKQFKPHKPKRSYKNHEQKKQNMVSAIELEPFDFELEVFDIDREGFNNEREVFDFEQEVFDIEREGFNNEREVFDFEQEVFDIEREGFNNEREVFDFEQEVIDVEREGFNIEREVFMSEVFGRDVMEFEFISKI